MENRAARIIAGLGSPFFLAPMAGFTDGVFRYICRRHGAALSYTEMLSAKGLYYNSPGGEEISRIEEREGPVAIQLFGSEPGMFRFAADKLKDSPAVFFDINMGCPVPKVVKNGEGSALMKDPVLAAECVRAAAEASKKPVTVKIRKGFSEKDASPGGCAAFAFAMQEAGAAAVAVHGRSREQFYSGRADWDCIKAVKQALSVPVIGSGDVFSAEDAVRMLEYTGCDAVMIARGARGNPWIFEEALALRDGRPLPPRPTAQEVVEAVILHLELLMEAKGEYTALRQMRQHSSFYTKGHKGAAEVRARLNTAETKEEFLKILNELKDKGDQL
jgi:tRNA-dihydrouridine synthase B